MVKVEYYPKGSENRIEWSFGTVSEAKDWLESEDIKHFKIWELVEDE